MTTRALAVVACCVVATIVSRAQIGKITQQDWVTSRADAQRTSWIRTDIVISPESMQKAGFQLQWKASLDNQQRPVNALNPGVVVGNLGFGSIPLSFITGSGNRVFAIDNDTGALFWQRTFGSTGIGGTPQCPGGITGAATRPATVLPTIPSWRGLQGRPPYTSGVGAPGEGVPASLMGRAGRGASAPAAVPSTPVRGAPAPTPAQAAPAPPVVYALSAEGQLHTLGVYSGKDVARPLSWLPPNAHASDLIALNNIVYTATMHGCGGVADGVWAVNLADQRSVVRTWRTEGGSPSGAPAFGSDGTLYVAVSGVTAAINGYANAIVALDPDDLTIRDWFTDPSTDFVTAPVVFKTGAREVVAAATRDGSIVLLDALSLGGPAHATALHRSSATGRARSAFVPGGLATWTDSSGTAWLLLPAETTVSAVKVSAGNGPPALEPGWTSRQMRAPIVPLIINGVAFVVSSGEFVPQVSATLAAADRARQSVPAVLYALDAATGRELWSSGKTITSFAHGPAVWPGIGQIHVATSDNTVYAFGFPLERY